MIKTGVGLYAFFGLGWLLAGVGHFGGATAGIAGLTGLVVALILVGAARKLWPKDDGQASEPLPALTRRRFGQVNAAQWVVIALVVVVCSAVGAPGLTMPLVAVVVGIHFVPLVRIFGDSRLFVPGVAFTVLGVAGLAARVAGASPEAVFTLVGVGSALTLWSTAAWTIAGARQAVQA